jgi:azurin
MKRTLPWLKIAALAAILPSLALAEPPEWSGSPDESLVIKTLPGMMRYDAAELSVPPGAKVKLTLENPDDLQHNLVLLKPDPADGDGQKFAQEAWLMGEKVIATGWVPRDHPRILSASALLNPAASETLYFIAPEEPGDYPYVCTVPGHSLLMRGIMRVRKAAKVLNDLTYSIYEGNWDKLPDFSTLKPVETGKLPEGRIDIGVAKNRKGGFGIVFEAKLTATVAEDYHFFLASDDGSRVIVNGEGIVDQDGIHPMGDPKEGKEKLQEGTHGIRVLYFEKSGNRGLSVGLRSKSLGWQDLSVEPSSRRATKAPPTPIPLTPKNGEAITHRAFLPGINPRGIAVGYPGGVNIAWDADVLNLGLVWRGGFLNVASHWEGRGSGSQLSGYDQIKTGHGMPMQRLESLDEPWIPTSTATIKYERDKENPEKDLTFNVRHPDYQFIGYRLDPKNRFPTFRYRYLDAEVSEGFAPETIEGREALIRAVSVTGAVPEDTWFRIADTGSLEKNEAGWHPVDDKLWIKIGGAEPVVRSVAGRKELLVPIEAAAPEKRFTVTYWWQTEIGGRVK